MDDLPAPWCSATMQGFPKPEGLGSQNLKHSPNLKVEVHETTNLRVEVPQTLNIHRIWPKHNQTVNIEELYKIVRFPGGILHPMGWFVRL